MANKKLTDVSSATSLSSIFVNADGSVKQIDIETLKQLLGIVEYSLPKAGSGSFGGVIANAATSDDTVPVRIKSDGSLVVPAYPTVNNYSLPIATSSTLGGVKPVAKTSAMTQSVGVDSSGRLYTVPPTTVSGGGTSDIVIDDTLSISGQAADAGAVGERLTSIENSISTSVNEVAALIGGNA